VQCVGYASTGNVPKVEEQLRPVNVTSGRAASGKWGPVANRNLEALSLQILFERLLQISALCLLFRCTLGVDGERSGVIHFDGFTDLIRPEGSAGTRQHFTSGWSD
jgi:hypothetical protein